MHFYNRDIGTFGENIAIEYLVNKGYILLEKNYRCKIGEIDIIAKDKDYIVFIEVKTRYGRKFGSPCESITKKKQYKIYHTAEFYIIMKKLNNSYFRFDVVEITMNSSNNNYLVNLIKNAFLI